MESTLFFKVDGVMDTLFVRRSRLWIQSLPCFWDTSLWELDTICILLTLKAPNKNCSRRHFNFLLLSFEENKAWFFMWILCLAEDSLETSSLILSEKQWKNIYECHLLLLIGALRVKGENLLQWVCIQRVIIYPPSATNTDTDFILSLQTDWIFQRKFFAR